MKTRRRSPRRDGLLDHVADGFLTQDLIRALAEVPSHKLEFMQYLLSSEQYVVGSAQAAYVSRALSLVREHTTHRARLIEYHGEQPLERGRCRGCNSPLSSNPGPGRPRAHCSPRCRQLTYRTRKRIQEELERDHNMIVESLLGLPPEHLEYLRRFVTKSPRRHHVHRCEVRSTAADDGAVGKVH